MKKPALVGGPPVRKEFLPYCLPIIGDDEINEVIETLKSGWITTGPKTQKFEEMFKEYIGSKYAIALSSCTAGLHLSLVAYGIGEGDEVITSPFTFASTANVIVHQRAKPVFVDIDRETYNIDPEKIEDKISDKTKAIMPVHYAGQPCEMDKIIKIAREYKIAVLEDAAHAVGSEYKGQKIGTIGDITSFSFYVTKNMTTAEGGMVTTDKEELANDIRIWRLHGMSKGAWKRYSSKGSWYYEILFPGYKYNMTDIQASLGIHQLSKLEDFLRAREKLAKKYTKAFSDMPEIVEPSVKKHMRHAWHLYPVQVNTDLLRTNRDKFIEALRAENIGTSVHFIPLHRHPFYQKTFGFKRGDFPVADHIYERIVSLPLYPRMSMDDLDDVVKAVKKIVEYYRKS